MAVVSTRINANVSRVDAGLSCTHCGQILEGDVSDYLSHLPRYEGPVTDVGPQVFPDTSVFIDAEILFRQYYCPGCYTAFHTEVVPK